MAIRILIADDSTAVQLILENLRDVYQFEVIQASNGEEAVDIALVDQGIDVIIMDFRMPYMEGDDAVRMIREFSDVPIVALSAYTDKKSRETMIRAGANIFVEKPFDFRSLASKIQGLVNQHKFRTMDFKKIRELKVRRLQKLREQAALFGVNVPPEIAMEIEDLEQELDNEQ